MPRLQDLVRIQPVISRFGKNNPAAARSFDIAMRGSAMTCRPLAPTDGGNLAFGIFRETSASAWAVGVIQVETCYFEQSCHVFL